jgi:hypothetical protein
MNANEFRGELNNLRSWQERAQRIQGQLKQTESALASRQEKLLGLRSDFDALTLAFWHQFKQNLAPHQEDPGKVFGLLKFIPGSLIIFIFVWVGANWSNLVPLGAAGLGGLCILTLIRLCVEGRICLHNGSDRRNGNGLAGLGDIRRSLAWFGKSAHAHLYAAERQIGRQRSILVRLCCADFCAPSNQSIFGYWTSNDRKLYRIGPLRLFS